VPDLDGLLPRFNNTVSLLDLLGNAIKAVTGNASGQLSYDNEAGVISYVSGTTTLRLIPLGDVSVQLNRFAETYPTAVAGGAYMVTLAGGIQMSLSAAVGYFSDLQAAVKAADANGTMSLKPTGAIEIRLLASRYVVMPGSTASLPGNPTFSPGFEVDASGNLVFRDHLGTLQALYPAFLDADTLSSTFKVALPTAFLTSNGDGTVTASLLGQSYILRPEYLVIDPPVGNALDAYWRNSGMIYLRNADLSAQPFSVY
jgi:hypothetical protein